MNTALIAMRNDDPAHPPATGTGVAGPNILQAAKANVAFKK